MEFGGNTRMVSGFVDHWKLQIPIGSGRTQIPMEKYVIVDWTSYKTAARDLLMAVYPVDALVTHLMAGVPLEKELLNDILREIRGRFDVPAIAVKSAIERMCTEQYMMWRNRLMNEPELEY